MSHLPVRRNAQVALRKAKNLIEVTDRILAGRETRLAATDDGWMQRLWDWADENDIPDPAVDSDDRLDKGWLPRDRQWLMEFKHFYLFKCEMTELPPEVGNLVNLELLEFVFCPELTGLPPEIGDLVNLKILILGRGNHLTELPPEIGNLVNLRTLTFGGHLTELPPEIGSLVNLGILDLSCNQLTELPPEIGNLVNLNRLNLKSNRLTKLPDEITRLTNLERLALDGNPLRLSDAQREWIAELEANGCEVLLDETAQQTVMPLGGDAKAVLPVVINDRWVRNTYENGDVTMTDKETGLMWLYDASLFGQMEWDDAAACCEKLTYAGYSDWRLPDKDELKAQCRQKEFFAGVQGSYYWSGTSHARDAGGAWGVSMYGGRAPLHLKAHHVYVWPVRGEQKKN